MKIEGDKKMKVDMVKLRILAETATGGDWEYRLGLIRTMPDADGYVPIAVAPNSPKSWRGQRDANMGFIAAAKPDAILSLLDELERLERNRDMWKAQCAVQAGQLERHVPLYEAINKAAGELPDGWEVVVRVEHEGGSVELVGPLGETYTDFPTNNERLDYTVCDALEFAVEKAGTDE